MTSEGLGEMFEGDSAEMRAGKIPLVPLGVRAEGSACADTGARTPIGARGIVNNNAHYLCPNFVIRTQLLIVFDQ